MKGTVLFIWKSRFDCSAAELYNWHARPGALQRLIPPWEDTWVLERNREGIRPGTKARLRVHFGPIPLSWHALHLSDEPGRGFAMNRAGGPLPFGDISISLLEAAMAGLCLKIELSTGCDFIISCRLC